MKVARRELLWILPIYLASRCFGLWYFAPHNDETLWIDLAQRIHAHWREFAFLPVDGRLYGFFLPPLQFWLTSTTVTFWENPLLGARLWSVAFGCLGLISLFGFTQRLWSTPAAICTALLVIFSEYFFYFDSIAMNEVYVYALGMTFLWMILRATLAFRETGKVTYGSIALAALCLGLAFLSKKVASLYLGMSAAIPLLAIAVPLAKDPRRPTHLKTLAYGYALIAVTAAGARLLEYLVIPRRFDVVRQADKATGDQIIPWSQAFSRGFAEWFGKLKDYFSLIVTPDYGHLTWILAFGVIVGAAIIFYRQADRRKLFVMVIVLFILSVLPQILFVASRYPRHWGVGCYAWYLLVGIALSELIGSLKIPRWPSRVIPIFLVLVAVWTKASVAYLPLRTWGQTDFALLETRPGWNSGLGVSTLVRKLRGLPAGTVFHDPRWGLPGMTVRIFHKVYPQLRIYPLNNPMMQQLQPQMTAGRTAPHNTYFVFDPQDCPNPRFLEALRANPQWCGEQTLIPKNYRDQVYAHSHFVICATP